MNEESMIPFSVKHENPETKIECKNDEEVLDDEDLKLSPRVILFGSSISSNREALDRMLDTKNATFKLNRRLSIILKSFVRKKQNMVEEIHNRPKSYFHRFCACSNSKHSHVVPFRHDCEIEMKRRKVLERRKKKIMRKKKKVLTLKTFQRLVKVKKNQKFVPPPPRYFLPLNKRIPNKKTRKVIRKRKRKRKKGGKGNRFVRKTLSYRNLLRLLDLKRSRKEKRIMNKISNACNRRITNVKYIKDCERKLKLGVFVAIMSRVFVLGHNLTLDRIKRKKRRMKANTEIIGDIIMVQVRKRRRKRWMSSFYDVFQKNFVFYKLHYSVIIKRRQMKKIQDFLLSLKAQNMFMIVMRKFQHNVKRIQERWRYRMKIEQAKIMMNFLKWSLREAEMIIKDFPKELFLEMENKHETSIEGSFTYIISSPALKFRTIRSIISQNQMDLFYLDERETLGLFSEDRISSLVLKGFKYQKRQEILLRKDFEKDEKYEKVFRLLQIQHYSEVICKTEQIIESYFGSSKYKCIFQLSKSKVLEISKQRLKDRMNY